MPIRDEGERRFELPDGLTPEEERAILMALERYFIAESPRRRRGCCRGASTPRASGPCRPAATHGNLGTDSRRRSLARACPPSTAAATSGSAGRTGTLPHTETDLGAIKTSGSADREAALAAFRAEGCGAPRSWSNGPADRYGSHDHGFHKVLFCLEGSIVFHTDEGDVAAEPRRPARPAARHHARGDRRADRMLVHRGRTTVKIAFHIDQLWFTVPGGIGTYIRELAPAMLEQDPTLRARTVPIAMGSVGAAGVVAAPAATGGHRGSTDP